MTTLAFLFAVFLARRAVLRPRRGRGRARRPRHRPLPEGPAVDLAGRAQFIVVTHQKRTMEAADSLSGVSMAGNGVLEGDLPPAAACGRGPGGGCSVKDEAIEISASPTRPRWSSLPSSLASVAVAAGSGSSERQAWPAPPRSARPASSAARASRAARRSSAARHRAGVVVAQAGVIGGVAAAAPSAASAAVELLGLRPGASAASASRARRQDRRAQVTIRRAIPEPARGRPRREPLQRLPRLRRRDGRGRLHDVRLEQPHSADHARRQAQPRPGPQISEAKVSVEVEDVDALHAEAVPRRGLEIVYPLTDEPWGIRRFFVREPDGTVINVAQHV